MAERRAVPVLAPRSVVALAVVFTFGARILGLRSGPRDIAGSWLSSTLTLPGWLEPLADILVAAALVALAAELLLGPRGLAAHVTRERVALVPAGACLCVGGGAMSATMATMMFGAVLGVEVLVAFSVLLAVALASLGAMGAIMILTGVRLYELFERLLGPQRWDRG